MDAKTWTILLLFGTAVNCATIGDQGEKEEDDVPFSKRWRDIYGDKQLMKQAKWALAENQPEDGSYEVREYQQQWWVMSHSPCYGQLVAMSHGYMDLYFFINGFNYREMRFPFTYPTLFHVDMRPAEDAHTIAVRSVGKKPKRERKCPVRYSTFFYLLLSTDEEAPLTDKTSIMPIKGPQSVRYVREYFGNYTSAYCNEQAKILADSLTENAVSFEENAWFCATYEPGYKENTQRYEVWFVQKVKEEENSDKIEKDQ